jgi:hypothetical protein
MKSMFSRISEMNSGFTRATKIAFAERKQHRQRMTLCLFCPGQSFFPQKRLRTRRAVVALTKNERIDR